MPNKNGKRRAQHKTPAQQNARGRRKARRAIVPKQVSPAIDPATLRYLECAAGGQPAGTGVPDGDGRLSIVKNFRDIKTITPSSGGTIEFYLVMTPHGHITVTTGSCTAETTGYGVDETSGAVYAQTVSRTTPISDQVHYGPAYLGVTPTTVYGTTNPAVASQWRVVNSRWHIMYTGPKLSAAGHCVITPLNASDRLGGMVHPVSGTPMPMFESANVGGTLMNPGSISKPANRDTVITLIPRDTSYQDANDIISSRLTGDVMGITRIATSGMKHVNMRPHQSCRVYQVRFTGLAADASVTVDNSACIQYLVDPDGIEAPLARPSAAGNQTILNQFLASISSHPAIGETVAEVKKGIFHAAGLALANFGKQAVRALPALMF